MVFHTCSNPNTFEGVLGTLDIFESGSTHVFLSPAHLSQQGWISNVSIDGVWLTACCPALSRKRPDHLKEHEPKLYDFGSLFHN